MRHRSRAARSRRTAPAVVLAALVFSVALSTPALSGPVAGGGVPLELSVSEREPTSVSAGGLSSQVTASTIKTVASQQLSTTSSMMAGTGSDGDALAWTGTDVLRLVVPGLFLLLGGVVLIRLFRQRSGAHTP